MHDAGSFAGLGYLAMYLAGKLRVFNHEGHSWKLFPVILPLLGATAVAITRVADYWHHWTDVSAGAAIGEHFTSLHHWKGPMQITFAKTEPKILTGNPTHCLRLVQTSVCTNFCSQLCCFDTCGLYCSDCPNNRNEHDEGGTSVFVIWHCN